MMNKILRVIQNLFLAVYYVIVACFIAGVIFILYQIYVLNRYESQKKIADPKFRFANEMLALNIPVPERVTEYDRSSSSNGYGVVLTIEYMRSPFISSDAVWEDYQQQFLQKGWTEKKITTHNRLYVKDTACAEISMLENMQNEISQDYRVNIWYDYRSQPFSPNVPPDWLVTLITFDEKGVVTCP